MTEQRRLQASTIRWSWDAHQLVQREAAAAGVSFSQYVRESALVRAAIMQSVRGGGPMATAREVFDRLQGAKTAPAPEGAAESLGEAADAILVHAPHELNAILRRLDDVVPEVATSVRRLYGLEVGSYAPTPEGS